MEQNDEWAEARRCIGPGILAKITTAASSGTGPDAIGNRERAAMVAKMPAVDWQWVNPAAP